MVSTFEEKETTIDGVKIRTVKCIDNKSVHLATTFDSAAPVSTAKLYDEIKKCYLDIPCTHAIST